MAYQPHSFMFQHHEEDRHHHIASNPNSNLFHGGGGHETAVMMMKRSFSFEDRGGGGDQDDMSDDGSQGVIGEMKKKRLSFEQVKTLEKSFEIGNKLEPERKLQLANALGLQPRQVAIWFQNRRARWKTKQLEKDYDVLRKQFDLVKADNDSLHAQNKKLHAQLSALKGTDSSKGNQKKDHQQGDQGSWSNNGSDQNSSDNNNNNNINLDISTAQPQVITSSASSQMINGKNLFPSNLRPSSITQLLQSSATTRSHDHQILQSDENFCNMLVNGGSVAGAEEADHHHQQGPTGFWPWTEQHYFH